MRRHGSFLMIFGVRQRRYRAVAASMSTCRSSAGCKRPAGYGRFGTFCAEHAAALAELRSMHFTAEGTARAHPVAAAEQGPTTEDDALRVATEVRLEGTIARNVLQDRLGWTYTRFRRAVELAGRSSWIVPGRRLALGAVLPLAHDAARSRGASVARASAC